MKSSLVLKQLLNKVNVSNKAELEDMINNIPDNDLPDEFESVLNSLSTLHTEESAKSAKGIADFHTGKYKDNLSKAMVSKLQAKGYEEEEIDEILREPFENRWEKALTITENKVRKNVTMTESERVKQEEDKWKREKERGDRLQAMSLEKEDRIKREVENEMIVFEIKNLVGALELTPDVPREKCIDWITNELMEKLNNSNAAIVRSGRSLKLVRADDTTLDYFDDKNNPLSLNRLLDEVGRGLNLLKKRENNSQKKETFKASTNTSARKVPKMSEYYSKLVNDLI